MLIVGIVVLGSVLLGVMHRPKWFWVTGVMGAHLIQASFTGICPVVTTLKKLGLQRRPGFS